MADDVRISVGLRNHRKTKRLRRQLGAGGCWSLVCLFLYAGDERWTGDLSGMTDADIEEEAAWEGDPGAFVAALLEHRFLIGEPGARAIHDWQEHNPYAASKGDRIARGKAGAAGKWGDRKEAAATRSARLAAARAKGRHTPEQWSALLAFCGNCCVRCGSADGIVKDHITPLYQGGSDGIDNLQPLCKSCNSSKGPDDTDHRPVNWAECLLDACKTPANACGVVCPPAPAPTPTLPVEAKAKAKADAPSAKRGQRLPLDWEPSDDDVAFAVGLRVDWRRERDSFRDYWFSKSGQDACKLDWSATWRNWIRRSSNRVAVQQPPAKSKTLQAIERIARMTHGQPLDGEGDRDGLIEAPMFETRRLSFGGHD